MYIYIHIFMYKYIYVRGRARWQCSSPASKFFFARCLARCLAMLAVEGWREGPQPEWLLGAAASSTQNWKCQDPDPESLAFWTPPPISSRHSKKDWLLGSSHVQCNGHHRANMAHVRQSRLHSGHCGRIKALSCYRGTSLKRNRQPPRTTSGP